MNEEQFEKDTDAIAEDFNVFIEKYHQSDMHPQDFAVIMSSLVAVMVYTVFPDIDMADFALQNAKDETRQQLIFNGDIEEKDQNINKKTTPSQAFMHCDICMSNLPEGVSPKSYARLSIGKTDNGVMVWCVRHNEGVIHLPYDWKSFQKLNGKVKCSTNGCGC